MPLKALVIAASTEPAQEMVRETHCHSHSFHTHPYHPPITPHPHHPPITPHPYHPPITPPQLQSPISLYANNLRAVYKRSKLSNPACYKWLRSPGKKFKFINLAVISKEKMVKEEADKIKKETIHGHIDLILKKKATIAIENILQVEQGQSLTCVLIEGAPGVGKSILAWELCRRWERGELFHDFSIVLLVTLRDERVQGATCVADLFCHCGKKLQEEVVQKICETNGKGILILLEGLDELPKRILTGYSIITDLLSGSIFPEATLLITSRPSATNKLWQKWWQQISRHIEILGFTEDNIDEYTKSVLPDHQFSGFKNYLSIHPHIKSMMYVPLHCAIATTVYLQCQHSDRPPPNTLTGLYTCLARIILEQYLQDHPDYKEDDYELNALSDLPSSVYDHFKKLCSLAFDGVDKQQLIFRSLPQKFEHLGFMDAVPERLMLSQKSANYSYNFLHLSVQEYLAAYHISLMSLHDQEQLLRKVRYGDHRFSMIRFLAGITQLMHLNKEVVKEVVGIKNMYSKEEVEIPEYALEFLYECQDVSILDSKSSYHANIQSTDSVHRLMALGYSVAKSSSKWHIVFSGRENSGSDVLGHSFKENPNPTYSIEHIEYKSCAPDFTQQVLQHLPEYTLKKIKKMSIHHDSTQPLPSYLPELIPKMEILNTLTLENILDTSLTKLIPVLSRVTVPKNIVLSDRKFTFEMHFPEHLSTGTIKSVNFTPYLLGQLLSVLPLQIVACVQTLIIEYRSRYRYSYDEHDSFQSLPPCLPKLISRMERLNALTLDNVLDTSLMELLPALSRVTTLRNLNILTNSGILKLFHTDDLLPIGTIETTSDSILVTQLLLYLPQQIRAHIGSLTMNSYKDPKPLPPSLPELIPTMERLNTLTLKNVLDTSLTKLIPVLFRVPSLRNLTLPKLNPEGINHLCQWIPTCLLEKLVICITASTFREGMVTITFCNNSIEAIECLHCTTEILMIDQVLSQMPQQSIKTLTVLEINNQPLPPRLHEVIPRMERLNTLTLKNVFDTSLTELIPSLSRVPTLRRLLISDNKSNFEMNIPSNTLSTCTINSVGCTQKFLDQLVPALPQQSIAYINSVAINYRKYSRAQPLPSCLLKLVPNLHSLSFTTVLDATLIALMPLLSTIPMRNLTLNISLDKHQHHEADKFTYSTLNGVCSCTCTSPEVIEQLLQCLPQQHMAYIQAFEVNYFKSKPLPPCLPKLIPQMKGLNTLTLKNAFDDTLTEVIPVLSGVLTLRKLLISNNKGCNFEMNIPSNTLSTCTINSEGYTQKFLDQLVPALPQQSIAYINSVAINYKKYSRAQPLPSCLLKLVPYLHSLSFTTVLDATLRALMSLLSTVPTTRSLTLNISLDERQHYDANKFTYGTLKDICTCTCTSPEIIEQLLQSLPQQHVAQIQSLQVNYNTLKPLPLCMLKLIPQMERLNTLTLKNVWKSSLLELMAVLSRIPTMSKISIILNSKDNVCVNPRSNFLLTGRSQALITCETVFNVTMYYCNSIIEAIECMYSETEFLDQILKQTSQNFMPQIKALTIIAKKVVKNEQKEEDKHRYRGRYEDDYYEDEDEDSEDDYYDEDDENSHCIPLPIPPCLLELIPRMENLNTLTLEDVLDSSVADVVPALSRLPTLKNLKILTNSGNLQMLTDIDPFSITINGTQNLIALFFSQLPQQSVAHITSLSVTWSNSQPIPPCLPELIPRMETLNTLILENTVDTSLTELIPALYRVPTLRNLTLYNLNPEGIAPFCQWLPTCKLERLVIIASKTVYEMSLTLSFCNSSIEAIECFRYCPTYFLLQIPQHLLAQVKTLKICNRETLLLSEDELDGNDFPRIYRQPQPLPPCLPELILKMETLNTLILEKIPDTSLTELIPALSRIPTLRNLKLRELNSWSKGRALLRQKLPACQLETL